MGAALAFYSAFALAPLLIIASAVAGLAPSMREIPLESNTEALAFARTLMDGGFDMVIFLTGVGTRALARVVETIYPLEQYLAELRKIAVVARGPKPVAVLREWNVQIALTAPEPNTWRELLRALDEHAAAVTLKGRRVAVQEYGVSNRELLAGRENHLCSRLRMGFARRHRTAALRDCRDSTQRNGRDPFYNGDASRSSAANCQGNERGGRNAWSALPDGRGVHRPHDQREASRIRDRSGPRAGAPEDGIPRQRSGAAQRGIIAA